MFTHYLIAEALVRQHQADLVHDARLPGHDLRSDDVRPRRRFSLRG